MKQKQKQKPRLRSFRLNPRTIKFTKHRKSKPALLSLYESPIEFGLSVEDNDRKNIQEGDVYLVVHNALSPLEARRAIQKFLSLVRKGEIIA